MELHALERQLAVAQAHDHVAGARRHLELVRQPLGAHDERVVAADHERGFEAREDRPAVVLGLGGLAVHRLAAHHRPAELGGERLVAEADAEHRHARLGVAADRLASRGPASSGVQGPGETITRSGSRSSSSGTSLRTTSTSAPSSPRYWTRL